MSQISIILPTYNVEKYIARAIESCINQTFKDIEIVVVDDCGNDKSIEIAKKYASKDDRIKIIHNKENLKLLRARCEGVKVATSPYIMFLDPDDYLEFNACEECIKILNTDIEMICFNTYIINGAKIPVKNYSIDIYSIKDYLIYLFNKDNFIWNAWGKLFKKDILLKSFNDLDLGNNKITMAEDALIFASYTKNITKIKTISECLYNYNCENINSTTNQKNINEIKRYLKDLEYCIQKLSAYNYNIHHYLFCQYVISCLQIHNYDLYYKNIAKNFIHKFILRLQRKKIKNFRKNILKKIKNL
ncbi:glycosyltransferase family 2 protein [Campylobacter lari]|uniref:glycosyltransferase family 2 protein n=1 Tax=Campylobacter lari TaxID=201 RepID=UPI00126CADD3|nr:glycosyltransferase family 2 protein [Campylobacter lari]EAI5529496.1 glycosyltransferase family 2 protein [Campylobacter lari]EAJ0323979.1 glycosyltransferase family 2 protein [Campylobacter lari]EAJ0341403.1 glycosyltransferase family 2 protein [Campylobacter lari]EAK0945206.1 glycosyltransferase family 2 protein [Campylobacter lari]EAK0948671.1 glycosyltransferase family 2 protein [Campylobacter lari]